MSATLTPGQQQYAEYLRSPRWRILRAVRKRIDGNCCRVCFGTERLEVHHEHYTHRGRGGLLGMVRELRDLRTLCKHHHREAHRLSG